MPCELPAELDWPLSRFSMADIRNETIRRGLVASIGKTTLWRWLSEGAIRPWYHRTWIFPRDPRFAEKAVRILELYEGLWEGTPLNEAECVLSTDDNPCDWRAARKLIRDKCTGDPRPLEQTLRDYHDHVTAAGGVLYLFGERGGRDAEKAKLSRAISASLGEIVASGPSSGHLDQEWIWLLKTKGAHKALDNVSTRRQIPTRADDKHYALLRAAGDSSEPILVVMNFQSTAQTIEVDMSGIATAGLVEPKSGESFI